MKKVIIHTEDIKRKGMKIQFQVKLPDTADCVTGILATLSPVHDPIEGGDSLAENRGAFWLRVSENRDVFYSDIVAESKALIVSHSGLTEVGLAGNPNWWFSGKKHEFFPVTVPVEDTIIEGFYLDESTKEVTDYQLRIYLQLETK